MRQLRIGHTPLREYHQISGLCHRAKVFIKDESANEISGTHKDRRCEALLATIKPDESAVLVHITCGNSGLSTGELTKQLAESEGKDWKDFRIQVVNIVSKDIPRVVKDRLRECSIVHEMDLSKHEVTQEEMREIARKLTSCSDEQIRMVESYKLPQGYGNIVHEIQEDLAAKGITLPPTHLICPIGSGELVVELEAEARRIWGSNAPLIIGVTTPKNAIALGSEFSKKRDRSVADKLTAPCTPYHEMADDLVRSGRLNLLTVSDGKILRAYRRLQELGIHSEPSAAAGFAGAFSYGFSSDDRVVIINTGEGIYDKKAVEKHWVKRLITGLKYAAVAAVAAAVTTLAVWGYIRQEIQVQDLNRKLLEAQALVYADEDRNYWLDEKEAMSICASIPGKKCDHPLAGRLVYGMDSFNDIELGYYVAHTEALKMNDMIGRQISGDIYYAYIHNRFHYRDGKIIWEHFDHELSKWYWYSGSERVYEPESKDICPKNVRIPSICP
ncbi:Pyridoxal-phosphate dependent enzyme [Candidatus Bilamarchaeum dharawalense]|uniref:Pyridoxal-phosphate dependent enzyme n=1 Tax=Candidatus Bilamarchaeum dharawalense TaxID=2885759 RepID=A0A5E4LQ22_9ARCH|nr:Pyridoxal-phosphate dependent enzyme [Candidatus Bilamarchaeum dharawalense]